MPKPRMFLQKAARPGERGVGLLVFLFLLVISTVLGITAAVTDNTLCAPEDYNEAKDTWQS